MNINFLRLDELFRDKNQESQVRDIIKSRLADDRNQGECRYLTRFYDLPRSYICRTQAVCFKRKVFDHFRIIKSNERKPQINRLMDWKI